MNIWTHSINGNSLGRTDSVQLWRIKTFRYEQQLPKCDPSWGAMGQLPIGPVCIHKPHFTSPKSANLPRFDAELMQSHRADPWQEAFLKAPERSKGSRDPLLREKGSKSTYILLLTLPLIDFCQICLLEWWGWWFFQKPFKHVKTC